MQSDTLKERLKLAELDLNTITTFYQNSSIADEHTKLHERSLAEDFWKEAEQATLLKRLQQLKLLRDTYESLKNAQSELSDMITLFESDESSLAQIATEVNGHCRAVARFKIQLLLSQPTDDANCFVTINSGAGGTESQDWTEILLRMYVRFCEREKLHVSIVDFQPGDGAGIKSATLLIKGPYAHGLLKCEHGIHRLVRISPFDASKRRHTSFAGVHVLPEVPEISVSINPADLRIDTYRASGAGGQHVNKTESAVRITHLPTGIVTQCQNERSQIQNRETAMKMLIAKISAKQKEEQLAEQSKIEKKSIEWGSQIRSYVLHPYKLVKDHRTDIESPQPDTVLDGDLMAFIEGYLVQQAG
jgi:peptide chain release factor 2